MPEDLQRRALLNAAHRQKFRLDELRLAAALLVIHEARGLLRVAADAVTDDFVRDAAVDEELARDLLVFGHRPVTVLQNNAAQETVPRRFGHRVFRRVADARVVFDVLQQQLAVAPVKRQAAVER